MDKILPALSSLFFPALHLAVLIVLLTRPPFRGRGLLLGYVSLLFFNSLTGGIINCLYMWGDIGSDSYMGVMSWMGGLMGLAGIAGIVLLLLFILRAGAGGPPPPPVSFPALAAATSEKMQEHLRACLPDRVKVSASGTDPVVVVIEDGLWRGVRVEIAAAVNGTRSIRPAYYIPTWKARVMIILASCLIFSLLLTMVVSVVAGRFEPIAAVGGAAGFAMYGLVRMALVSMIRNGWSVELAPVFRSLQETA